VVHVWEVVVLRKVGSNSNASVCSHNSTFYYTRSCLENILCAAMSQQTLNLQHCQSELDSNLVVSALHHHHIVPLTVMSGGEVSAALTLSSLRMAVLAVAVAVAWSALREAPETWLAVGTLATCCS